MKRSEMEIMKLAIDTWGEQSQLEMLQEESTELALAARKFIRVQNDERFQNLASEIADVEIMINQIKIMFPTLGHIVENEKIFKIDSLEKRLDKLNFEDEK